MLLVCDHAANHIPEKYAGLGLNADLLEDHVAWDIGAWDLACLLSDLLDAPLVGASASRLLIDPNRDLAAPDLIPTHAEGVPIPGNQELDEAEREARHAAYHVPFHHAIETILASSQPFCAIVSIHSFTPVLFGKPRPWQAGVLHAEDTRLADLLLAAFARSGELRVGRNEPYGPGDGVYYTLDRHAAGLATAMIEVRNDALRDEIGRHRWARLLADVLTDAIAILQKGSQARMGFLGKGNGNG